MNVQLNKDTATALLQLATLGAQTQVQSLNRVLEEADAAIKAVSEVVDDSASE